MAGNADIIKGLRKVKSQIDSGGPIFIQKAVAKGLNLYNSVKKPEIVENNVSGILISPNNEEEIIESILKFAKDYKLRKTFGENARERVNNKFNVEKNITSYVKLFNEAKKV